MIDEAHRTQSGDLGDNLVEGFPNAPRLAFTETLLIIVKDQQTTAQRFGDYIDKYTLQDAFDDTDRHHQNWGVILERRRKGKVPVKIDASIFSAALVWAAEPPYDHFAFRQMLRVTSGCAFSPQLERTRFEMRSHEFDDLTGGEFELLADGVESSAILPRHLDNSVDLFWLKI